MISNRASTGPTSPHLVVANGVARYTFAEAIAPCWHDVLARMGMPADPNPQQVVVWQASRRAAPAPRCEILEAIARRAAGETVAAIAADLGVDASNLRSRLTTPEPMLLTPWLTDVPGWRLGREQGRSTTELAALYEAPEHLLVLVLDGWLAPDGLDPDLAEQVLRQWRAGAQVEDIATGLDVPVSRLRRAAPRPFPTSRSPTMKMLSFTTSSCVQPASVRTARRFRSACAVCAAKPSSSAFSPEQLRPELDRC